MLQVFFFFCLPIWTSQTARSLQPHRPRFFNNIRTWKLLASLANAAVMLHCTNTHAARAHYATEESINHRFPMKSIEEPRRRRGVYFEKKNKRKNDSCTGCNTARSFRDFVKCSAFDTKIRIKVDTQV